MKYFLSVVLGGAAFIVSMFFLYSKASQKKPSPTVASHERDSLKIITFKKRMEEANSFLTLISKGKNTLTDTLWVRTPTNDLLGIWAKPFWGPERKAIYEIAIGDKFGTSKVILLDNNNGGFTWKYEKGGPGPNPDTDTFFYCFEGLLKTFCRQQNYELPVSD